MSSLLDAPITFIMNSGLYFIAGLIISVLLILGILFRVVIISAKKSSAKYFTNREGFIIIAAVIIVIAGFYCSYRDINSKGEAYSATDHPVAFEKIEPEAWKEIEPCWKENCWDNSWTLSASQRKCVFFDSIHEYIVDNWETYEYYELQYYDAKKEETITTYVNERLAIHEKYGDTIEYLDDGVIVVTDKSYSSINWAYVSYGDRLEIIQVQNGKDINEYVDFIREDVMKK